MGGIRCQKGIYLTLRAHKIIKRALQVFNRRSLTSCLYRSSIIIEQLSSICGLQAKIEFAAQMHPMLPCSAPVLTRIHRKYKAQGCICTTAPVVPVSLHIKLEVNQVSCILIEGCVCSTFHVTSTQTIPAYSPFPSLIACFVPYIKLRWLKVV